MDDVSRGELGTRVEEGQGIAYADRIVGFGRKRASEFTPHPDNPHIHPVGQRRVIAALLDEVGWIGVAIENVVTGYLIDGHERVMQALREGDQVVPFIQVSLSVEEEARALATYDPVGDMGRYSAETFDRLLGQFVVDDQATLKMFHQVLRKADRGIPTLNLDGVEPGSDGAEEAGDGGLEESAIVMRHLFLNTGNVGRFDEQTEALMAVRDIDNLTDLILSLVEGAYGNLHDS